VSIRTPPGPARAPQFSAAARRDGQHPRLADAQPDCGALRAGAPDRRPGAGRARHRHLPHRGEANRRPKRVRRYLLFTDLFIFNMYFFRQKCTTRLLACISLSFTRAICPLRWSSFRKNSYDIHARPISNPCFRCTSMMCSVWFACFSTRYANGIGFAEEHFDAYRALAGKRVDMPFSEATKDLLQRAGLEPT
jgi:hypothetical protein